MTSFLNDGGVYKRIYNAWYKHEGSWKLLDTAYVKAGGWKEIHRATRIFVCTINITTNTSNFNMYDALVARGWDTSSPVTVTVNISAGVVVSASSTVFYAFYTGAAYAVGSTLVINNLGTISGAGGKGGNGGYATVAGAVVTMVAGANGLSGGPALFIGLTTTLNNSSGVIAGGGGGGGGGGGAFYDSTRYTGGGGGGGAGTVSGLAGEFLNSSFVIVRPRATAGTATVGGTLGEGDVMSVDAYLTVAAGWGGNGGARGAAGANALWDAGYDGSGFTYNVLTSPSGVGGSAGPAIVGSALLTDTPTGTFYGVLN